ncbi:ATP-binding cassette domain-containing protein [Niallia endozanthoxylica]|uniref:ABC transporter ATP-binding protein n=1 Tax=Niallia endozanthoxylica TaxID=2036016 RepID=A0A5J5HUJ9_9BACI|nr:ABC transporter ATP-binding protein [Niallia endozanthoxylica]KAA9023975.1 ABC transporter ATP-binding protein [Niallia endozanthoxylica]
MKLFEAHNASKKIDGKGILHDISITISQREKIAITGANGSGKSSLLKLIGGIYEHSSGQVIRSPLKVGYVPEHFPETIRFKIYEYLMLTGKMNKKSKGEIKKKIEYYATAFSILPFLSTPLKNCSKGTKQKVGIIQALMKDPNLLLLDEPLTGLDEQTKKELLHLLQSIQGECTIIFTAHDSLLINRLAYREVVIENGKIVSDSTKSESEKIKYILAEIPSTDFILSIPSLSYQSRDGNRVEIMVTAAESDQVLRMLLDQGCSIVEVIEKR